MPWQIVAAREHSRGVGTGRNSRIRHATKERFGDWGTMAVSNIQQAVDSQAPAKNRVPELSIFEVPIGVAGYPETDTL